MDPMAYLKGLARRDELSHAWLLLGADPAGRESLAQYLAGALLCAAPAADRPCGVCPHCVKLKKGIHPDLVRYARLPDKRDLTVDQIRALRQEAYVLPNEAARKVYLVEDADSMNASAQNAFLKLLEEPPAYAAFLLLGVNPGSFLPTVRSRCVELRTSPVQAPPEEDGQAALLAAAYVAGDRLGFAKAAFRAEKLERERFERLLAALYAAAVRLAREGDPVSRAAACRLAEKTEALRDFRKVNVSPGHCLGWLLSSMEPRG